MIRVFCLTTGTTTMLKACVYIKKMIFRILQYQLSLIFLILQVTKTELFILNVIFTVFVDFIETL
jgi:hypothetical protein